MIKYLLVIAVIAFVYYFFIKKKPSKNIKKKKEKDSKMNDMVECCECSIYCEIDDAILSGSKYYCSSECLQKAK